MAKSMKKRVVKALTAAAKTVRRAVKKASDARSQEVGEEDFQKARCEEVVS